MSDLSARCPYCKHELTLTCEDRYKRLDLAKRACPHLVYLMGSDTDWELCPDGSTRVIGTMNIGWAHPHVAEVDPNGDLLADYLVDLTFGEAPCDAQTDSQVVRVRLEEDREMTDAEYRYQSQVARDYGTTVDRDRPIPDVDVEAKLLFAADAVAFIEEIAAMAAHGQ